MDDEKHDSSLPTSFREEIGKPKNKKASFHKLVDNNIPPNEIVQIHVTGNKNINSLINHSTTSEKTQQYISHTLTRSRGQEPSGCAMILSSPSKSGH